MRERLGESGRVSSLRIAADGPLRRSELDAAACTPACHPVALRGGSSSCSKRLQRRPVLRQRTPAAARARPAAAHTRRPVPPQLTPAPRPVLRPPALRSFGW